MFFSWLELYTCRHLIALQEADAWSRINRAFFFSFSFLTSSFTLGCLKTLYFYYLQLVLYSFWMYKWVSEISLHKTILLSRKGAFADATYFWSGMTSNLILWLSFAASVSDLLAFSNVLSTSRSSHHHAKRHSLVPAFGLSFLGYCRNMVVQHAGGRAPATSRYKKLILR